MKKFFLGTALTTVLAVTPAYADPTVSVGVSISFGGNAKPQLGISGRVLSDDRRDRLVGAAGVTYYPGSRKWGVDAGIGYNVKNTTIALTYDFLNKQPLMSAGWANLTPSVC